MYALSISGVVQTSQDYDFLWTIVAVLLVIALLIYIVRGFR